MNKLNIVLAAALCAAFVSEAGVRRLEEVVIGEGATATVKNPGADDAKANDPRVASALVRSKDISVTGLGLGLTEVILTDERGAFASFPVKVVPSYWNVLTKIFIDDPEISREVVGGKVILSGATASSDTMRRVDEAKALDPERIVSQVTSSPEAIQSIVTEYLRRSNQTNVAAKVVGREVSLSGRVFDPAMAKSLKERVQALLKDFPGITVNVEEVRTYKQKILIGIEFIQWNDTRARNLGIKLNDTISISAGSSYKYKWGKDAEGKTTETHDSDFNAESASGGGGTGVGGGLQATINIAKQKGVAKKTYGTQLATQSGEPAEFKNGGTLYVKTNAGGLTSGDLKQFDWGYNIVARPIIVDRDTVNLDFTLDYTKLVNLSTARASGEYQLDRYTTKSKYIVKPGESIVLSGFKSEEGAETKNGWPFLSHIWGLQWLFGNTSRERDEKEMLLVVTINWLVEDSASAKERYQKINEREVSVEMP